MSTNYDHNDVKSVRSQGDRSRLTFEVDSDLLERINDVLKEQGVTIRALCTQAIREYLAPNRLSLGIDSGLLAEIEGVAHRRSQSVPAFCIDAVKEALTPSVRFFPQQSSRAESVADFLRDAQDIVMAGLTLATVKEEELFSVLCRKVEEDRPMCFVTVDPQVLDEDERTYEILTAHYGGTDPGGVRKTLSDTHAKLAELVELSKRMHAGNAVQVIVTKRIPDCGLTIVDQLSIKCRLRVTPYLELVPRIWHPVFEINTEHPEGRAAALPFLQHFQFISRAGQARALFDNSK